VLSTSTQTPTLQACRECGAGSPLDAHFCPQCTKILSLPRHADYFSFLGLPRKLNLDAADLDQRFRALSRQFHPDYFYNATTAERRASLLRTTILPQSRQILDVSRIGYQSDRVEFLALVDNERTLLSAELEYSRASRNPAKCRSRPMRKSCKGCTAI